ncbi:MAG: MBL fold metallo-hydrolase [Deltaproteobacteria bacterium]|nr:MBL fold metallo-hydrolase [Deltaproteobacteria bacterium]
MLTNKSWQPLPGTRQAEIYPYTRKPDLLSSNSCLIRTPEQIVLIDAGALFAQTVDLCRIIKESLQERPRPVLIYLTHCHIDHVLHVDTYRQILTEAFVRVAIQEDGAHYLAEGNQQKTIAELYGIPFPPIQSNIHLLTAQDRENGGYRHIHLEPGVLLTLQMEAVPTDMERPFLRQTISIGGGDNLEVYPATGHSRDSVCILIGEILFIGDLLAAVNPMLAGISDWNRDDLIHTLKQVLWLLENKPIRFCFPGHGGIFPVDKTKELLQRMLGKISRMGAVTEMNKDRLFQVTDFALELIDEAEEVFSSIAGRLLYVAYQLEQLEEDDAAEHCRTAMNMDQIDACLFEFRTLCVCLDAGEILRVEFAFGVLRVVEKIKTLFDPRPLSAILPQSMINRGTSLLLDFIGIANGYRNLEEFIPADLNALLEDVIQAWQSNPHIDTSIVDFADDNEKYLAALVARIGYRPAADLPALCFAPTDNLPFVRIAAARFGDTLPDFLEWLKKAAPASINIATGIDRSRPFIAIMPQGRDGLPATPLHGGKINTFTRRFHLCGMTLKTEKDGFLLTFAFDQGG